MTIDITKRTTVALASALQLPATGERYVPEYGGNIALEHLHRYFMACELAAGKVVLDIASGEGYGSWLLAKVAQSVIGVDLAADAVAHAAAKYSTENLAFMVGSCSRIPVLDASVDLVVSFETIEHHDQHKEMMAEIRRVLRPRGVLIISSPDKKEYSDLPGYANPFHVKELYRDEFRSLLDATFANVALYGQRVSYGSNVRREDGAGPYLSHFWSEDTVTSTPGVWRPVYLVAIATDGEVPVVSGGLFEQPVDETDLARALADREARLAASLSEVKLWADQTEGLSREAVERDLQIATLTSAVAERDGQIATLTAAVAERDGQIATLTAAVAERDGQIATLTGAVTERDGQITTLAGAVAERDGQIATLTGAVTERDGQIATLTGAVTERDGQIATLAGAVAERDVRLADVGSHLRALTVHRDALVRSTSWRLTRPLRIVGNAAKFVLRPRGQRAIRTRPIAPDNFASRADPERGEPSQERLVDPKKTPFSNAMNPKISIVIPTLNGGEYFRQLAMQLTRQVTDFDFEIVVIDSGSTDGTIDVASKIGCKILRVAPGEFNHGATRNKAIAASSGEFIVLMTQDAVPADQFLLWSITRPFSDVSVAGVFARQSPRAEADPITKRNLNGWVTGRLQPEKRSVVSDEAFRSLSSMDQLLLCTFDNVCSAIRRSVWLREPFSAMKFGEDIEWSKRVLTSGWTIAYEPQAHVIHSHDRSAIYEYKRNYMCHQTLFRLFQLQTVPTIQHACKAIVHGTLMDLRHVYREKMPLPQKLALLLRVPLMTFASVCGQYQGARDERLGKAHAVRGV